MPCFGCVRLLCCFRERSQDGLVIGFIDPQIGGLVEWRAGAWFREWGGVTRECDALIVSGHCTIWVHFKNGNVDFCFQIIISLHTILVWKLYESLYVGMPELLPPVNLYI